MADDIPQRGIDKLTENPEKLEAELDTVDSDSDDSNFSDREDDGSSEDRAGEGASLEGPKFRPARFWQDLLVGRERQPELGKLLIEEIEARWARSTTRLRGLVSGRIELLLGDRVSGPRGVSKIFEWRQSAVPASGESSPSVKSEDGAEGGEVVKTSTPTAAVDCTIQLSEHTLLRIAAGELNAQVAMISDKVKVRGTSGLAVYFFNLIAPRQN